jgi:hypothetical protein
MKRSLWIAIAGACLAGGCSTDNRGSNAEAAPSISLNSHNREVLAGDTTTLTVNSRNTIGRDARIEWSTTGGQLTTEENGRIARVRFDTPGMYTVTSHLLMGEQEVSRDSVNINVKPLR